MSLPCPSLEPYVLFFPYLNSYFYFFIFYSFCTHTNFIYLLIFFQGVSVEAVDPVFQAKMLDMLKQTGR